MVFVIYFSSIEVLIDTAPSISHCSFPSIGGNSTLNKIEKNVKIRMLHSPISISIKMSINLPILQNAG